MGQEAQSEVWDGSGIPPRRPGGPEGPPGGLGGVGSPSWSSRSGREPPGEPRAVGRPSWRAGRGRETHPEDRMGSRGPSGGLDGVGRPSRWVEVCREALPEGVGRPTCRSGRATERSKRGWEAQPEVFTAHTEVQKAHLKVREGSRGPPRGLEGPPGGPGGVWKPTRRTERHTRWSWRSWEAPRRSGRGRKTHLAVLDR